MTLRQDVKPALPADLQQVLDEDKG
jgi:hypothetical protein